jgi:hypothetical protein
VIAVEAEPTSNLVQFFLFDLIGSWDGQIRAARARASIPKYLLTNHGENPGAAARKNVAMATSRIFDD